MGIDKNARLHALFRRSGFKVPGRMGGSPILAMLRDRNRETIACPEIDEGGMNSVRAYFIAFDRDLRYLLNGISK